MYTRIAAACAALLLGVTGAHAAAVQGYEDITDNGDGSFTFVFDTLPSNPGDIDGTGMGIFFDDFGLTLTVTTTTVGGNVIQDYPADGGLGVDGTPTGTDNFEAGEFLIFSFNKLINLDQITFNGNHDPAPGTGELIIGDLTAGLQAGDLSARAAKISGLSNLCFRNASGFCGVTTFMVESSSFGGYIESITVTAVPLPAPILLLGGAIAGLGFASRRKNAA